jgi:hypothetical protein
MAQESDQPIVVDNPDVQVDILSRGRGPVGGERGVFRTCKPLTHLFVYDSEGLKLDGGPTAQEFLFTELNEAALLAFRLSADSQHKVESLMFRGPQRGLGEVNLHVAQNETDPNGSGLVEKFPGDARRFLLGGQSKRNITSISYSDAKTQHDAELSPDGRHIILVIPNGNLLLAKLLASAFNVALPDLRK